MSDRRYVAIHEAGHAVIGRVVRMPCGGASILPDDDLGSNGAATIATADDAWSAWDARGRFTRYASPCLARILAAMAGREAEAEILGIVTGDDEADRDVIAAELPDIGVADGSEHAAEARLRRFARQLVHRHRADIERVAAALEARETLTGEEIDALLPPTFMARPVTWALALPVEGMP